MRESRLIFYSKEIWAAHVAHEGIRTQHLPHARQAPYHEATFPPQLKERDATQDFTFMVWIIANDCACMMIYQSNKHHHKQMELWVIHMRINVTLDFGQLPTIANLNSIHSL